MYRVIKTTYHPSKSTEWFVQKLGITGWKTVCAGGQYGSGHHKSLESAEKYIESIQHKKRQAIYKPWYVSKLLKRQSNDTKKTCTYPKCNCPFDAPAGNFLCARSLKREQRNGKK